MASYRNRIVPGFDRVVRCEDERSGLLAIVAVHDRTLGPALGGCRMWPYENEREALADVCRLARGMTFKAAVAGLPLGGGKAVIVGDPRRDKSPELLRAFGRAVNRLEGAYVTAEDVGISVEDMEHVRRETRHVVGIRGGSGDPSPMTATGVLHGVRAAVRHRFGADSLEGVTVAVQGLGHVGFNLCRLLHEAGARLVAADIADDAVRRAATAFDAVSVRPEGIAAAKADVFAPCALGGAIDARTRARLKAGAVAGAANNQLARPEDGAGLHRDGILYAPDFVINAGGLIAGSWDLLHRGEPFDRERALAAVGRIGDRLDAIFRASADCGRPPERIAEQMAAERLSRPVAA